MRKVIIKIKKFSKFFFIRVLHIFEERRNHMAHIAAPSAFGRKERQVFTPELFRSVRSLPCQFSSVGFLSILQHTSHVYPKEHLQGKGYLQHGRNHQIQLPDTLLHLQQVGHSNCMCKQVTWKYRQKIEENSPRN